jgi:hypothetical protein
MAPPESWQLKPERRLAPLHLRSHNDDSVMMMVPAMMVIINNDHPIEGHQGLYEPYAGPDEKDCNCD